MKKAEKRELSNEGKLFLNDKRLFEALSKIASEVNATPEEYLLRFEEMLETNPELILGVLEGKVIF